MNDQAAIAFLVILIIQGIFVLLNVGWAFDGVFKTLKKYFRAASKYGELVIEIMIGAFLPAIILLLIIEIIINLLVYDYTGLITKIKKFLFPGLSNDE